MSKAISNLGLWVKIKKKKKQFDRRCDGIATSKYDYTAFHLGSHHVNSITFGRVQFPMQYCYHGLGLRAVGIYLDIIITQLIDSSKEQNHYSSF